MYIYLKIYKMMIVSNDKMTLLLRTKIKTRTTTKGMNRDGPCPRRMRVGMECRCFPQATIKVLEANRSRR